MFCSRHDLMSGRNALHPRQSWEKGLTYWQLPFRDFRLHEHCHCGSIIPFHSKHQSIDRAKLRQCAYGACCKREQHMMKNISNHVRLAWNGLYLFMYFQKKVFHDRQRFFMHFNISLERHRIKRLCLIDVSRCGSIKGWVLFTQISENGREITSTASSKTLFVRLL